MRRWLVVLPLLLAACGGSRSATPSTSAAPSSSASVAPLPTGPVTPTAGEDAAAFWLRRGVTPAPPTGFLDAYARVPVTGSTPVVTATLRSLAGEAYATDHLRLDLVDAGVLGTSGLSGDRSSILQAQQAGLAAGTTTLTAVTGTAVVTVPSADQASLGTYVVALRLSYGPFVGRFADGTSRTLAAHTETVAVAGNLVTTSVLGTFLFQTSQVDCSTAGASTVSAQACAKLPK